MSKFLFFLCVGGFVFGLECKGQIGGDRKEIIYGKVSNDGFSKVTKGAFWKIRPEAKAIYYGARPDSLEIYELESNYYASFVEGEHNKEDNNIIIIPKGELVYRDRNNNSDPWKPVKCANQLAFLRPVDMVTIKTIVINNSTTFEPKKEFPSIMFPKGYGSEQTIVNESATESYDQEVIVKTWFGRNWGWVAAFVGASVLTTGGIYLHNQNVGSRVTNPGHDATTTTTDEGGSRVTNTGHQ